MDSTIKSKLHQLLRLGLVSKNNIARALVMFKDPEKYSRQPAYRTLMQEILVDIIDKILNNRTAFTALRHDLTKSSRTPESVGEAFESQRRDILLRSGLVDKDKIITARRFLKSSKASKRLAANTVYREIMLDMLDSIVQKITSTPVMFNAFKKTLGDSVDESVSQPNTESIELSGLLEDANEIIETYSPSDPELWTSAKIAGKTMFDSAEHANAWAVKLYNEDGGGWKTAEEDDKDFFGFMKNINETIN